MEFAVAPTERRRLLVPTPSAIARLRAFFLQLLPKPLLTPDQVELLKRDNVVSAEAVEQGRTLAGLGIDPAAFEAIVPTYLWRFPKTRHFPPTPARAGPPPRFPSRGRPLPRRPPNPATP